MTDSTPYSSPALSESNQIPKFYRNESDRSTDVGSVAGDFLQSQCTSMTIIPQIAKSAMKKTKQKVDKTLNKCVDFQQKTSNCDKIVRLTASSLKVIKSFKLIQNIQSIKKIDKINNQLSLTRKVFRFNSKWSTIKQLYQLINKKNRKNLDTFNIFFKSFTFLSDINDQICYYMHLKLIKDNLCSKLKQISSDAYFLQCLIWIGFHTYQYLQMRKQIQNNKNISEETRKQHRKKLLTIIKYIFDTFTSYNDFSRRVATADSRLVMAAGLLSSIIGIIVAWK